MKSWRTFAIFLALAGGFGAALLALFHEEFAVGQLYPQFSTMRADEKGAKLLYASLSRLPEVKVSRNFRPLLSSGITGATLVVLNADPVSLGLPQQIEQLAGAGNRVVITFPDRFSPDSAERWGYRHWRLRFPTKKELEKDDLYFKDESEWKGMWKVIDDVRGRPITIERTLGKGSIVLVARSASFSNSDMESASDDDADMFDEVVDAIGTGPRIVFDESHLGVAENGSVVGLVERFRLVGFAAGLALLAALFIWRNAGSFPPAAIERAPRRAAGESGLRTLLRKHIQPGEVAATCWKEWLVSNQRSVSAERLQRAETALQSHPLQPVEALREIHAALYGKDLDKITGEPAKGTL
jgi:hypothetical protein